MSDAPPPFQHPMRLSELAQRKATRFALAPGAEDRARIAAWAGIEALPDLRFSGTLAPSGRRDWVLEGELVARAVQACVITLAPVTTAIREPVERRYLAEMVAPETDDAEIPEDVSAELLPAVVDLGAVMLEALELALPLYPRAPGAELGAVEVTETGLKPIQEQVLRPFAGLGDLLKRKRDG